MDYLVGERGGKWDQLQCEMHMVAPVRGHRKNWVGFPFLYECAPRVLLSSSAYVLPSCS